MLVGVVCPYDADRPGGVQQQARGLVARLRAAGDEARLVAAGTPEVGPTVTIPANRSRAPVTLTPRAWRRVGEALADVDVIHLHEPFVPLVGWAALAADRPTVATFHARPARWTTVLYRTGAPLGRRLLADRVLTAVSPVAASALPAAWGDVEVIPNGIDVGSYRLELSRDPHRVVFVGRDEPRKGLDVALAAWGEIHRRFPEARLRVVGARRDHPVDGVDYLGVVDEATKRRELAGAAVFVAPNLGGESFGIVVAEAMAAGCAPVVSALDAFRWVAADAAVLVPVGDPHALAEAVVGLLADRERRERIAEAARRRARAFDWGVVVGAYRSAYRRAVDGASR